MTNRVYYDTVSRNTPVDTRRPLPPQTGEYSGMQTTPVYRGRLKLGRFNCD